MVYGTVCTYYIYMFCNVYVYVYIYICIERQAEIKREREEAHLQATASAADLQNVAGNDFCLHLRSPGLPRVPLQASCSIWNALG